MKRVRRAWFAIMRALSVEQPKFEVEFELEEPVVEEEVLGPWHPKAIEMIETIWGKGFNQPGGPNHVLTLAKPFALDNQMNLLDISSGMGGGTIAVSTQFGCYSTLLENVPELAEISQRNIDMSEARSKIKLQEFDPAKITLKANSFDCILTREFLFRTEDKTRMLRTIKRAMRMYGQLSLTDFMLAEDKEPSPSLQKWIENEPFPVHLWTVHRYEQEIEALGMDVRISEDISKDYHSYMTRSFQSFIDRYQGGKINASKNQLPILLGEVERWARLAALIETGEVRVFRYFALKPVKA